MTDALYSRKALERVWSGRVHRVGAQEAIRTARQTRASWLAAMRKGAREQPRRRFASPRRSVLIARLQRAADEFHFEIKAVRMHRIVQAAPEIMIQTTDY